MKKLATIISIFVATATFSIAEASVQYFTSVQANRVVEFLNANPEILIYDANYPDNVDYVYTTDVWKEASGLSYEVWIYGYHISTNEVVSTPVDLDYVWINNGGYPVSVAQLLGFNTPVVNVRFAWAVPVYRPWVRAPHPTRYYRTYYYPHLRHHHHHHYAHRPHHHAAPAPHHHHVAPAPSHHGHGTAHHNPAPTPNRGYNHNPSHSGANHGGNGPANRPSYNGGGHSGHGNHSGSVGNRTAPSHNSGMSHSSHSGSTRSHSTASMSHSSSHSKGAGTRSHGGSHSGGHGHGGGHHGNSRR
ncbi:MAG: hypothetical protein IJP95_04905 [Bacteroidales bacterium]|nr:hypothetical protein [Bacteroidales bacterium]